MVLNSVKQDLVSLVPRHPGEGGEPLDEDSPLYQNSFNPLKAKPAVLWTASINACQIVNALIYTR